MSSRAEPAAAIQPEEAKWYVPRRNESSESAFGAWFAVDSRRLRRHWRTLVTDYHRDPPLPRNCRAAVTFGSQTLFPVSRQEATVFGGTRAFFMRSTKGDDKEGKEWDSDYEG